jgi:hypothetical protein
MFREQGHQDPGNARQQAARGTFDPAYLNYTMSKLMIKKLREDWTATRGKRDGWKDFNDQFLRYGGPPIPLVRKAMLGDVTGRCSNRFAWFWKEAELRPPRNAIQRRCARSR